MFNSRLSIQFSIEFLCVFFTFCATWGVLPEYLVEYQRGGGISGAIVAEYHSAISNNESVRFSISYGFLMIIYVF